MKLAQIRHLVAVAERGSLRASAEALGVSRTALMRSIRELEQELGTALFRRGRNAMALTPVGAIFVRRAAAAQAELDRASDEIGRHRGPGLEPPAGPVTIGLSASPLAAILPRVLTPFQDRFGAGRLRIAEGGFAALERPLRDGVLDLYVGPVGPDDGVDGLTVDRLYDDARIVVARAGHPLAGATSLAGLAGARWIAASRRDIDPAFERRGLPPPAIVVAAETGALAMVPAVAASDALLVVPASWLPLAARMGLVALAPDDGFDAEPVAMVARAQEPPTPAASHVRDLIVAAADGLRASAHDRPPVGGAGA